MPQIDEHFKWCMKYPRRLIKTNPDMDLAQKHKLQQFLVLLVLVTLFLKRRERSKGYILF